LLLKDIQIIKKKGIIFRIKISSGKDIKSFSAISTEDEILLSANLGYIVTEELRKNNDDGFYYLDISEKQSTFIY